MTEKNNTDNSNDKQNETNEQKIDENDNQQTNESEESQHIKFPLFLFNGLPPAGLLCAPLVVEHLNSEKENKMLEDSNNPRNQVLTENDVFMIKDVFYGNNNNDNNNDKNQNNDTNAENNNDNSNNNNDNNTENQQKINDESNENTDKNDKEKEKPKYKIGDIVSKYIMVHQLIGRVESKIHKNDYYYEIGVSLESHFQNMQRWKSSYIPKIQGIEDINEESLNEKYWMYDPRKLNQTMIDCSACNNENTTNKEKLFAKNYKSYEYPTTKWRCSSCITTFPPRYGGYNELNTQICKECNENINKSLRTLFLKFEDLPPFIQTNVEKRYQNPLKNLLKNRFIDINIFLNDHCLPII